MVCRLSLCFFRALTNQSCGMPCSGRCSCLKPSRPQMQPSTISIFAWRVLRLWCTQHLYPHNYHNLCWCGECFVRTSCTMKLHSSSFADAQVKVYPTFHQDFRERNAGDP